MAAIQATKDAVAPGNDSKNTLKIENTEKRDTLIADEKRYQKEWQEKKYFQADAPTIKEYPLNTVSAVELHKKYPKFFGTMPFPYLNGTLHAGHGFTMSKIEFMTGYQRMLGKRVLYPQGYHVTGMPIKACADKLVREIEMFGQNFENCTESVVSNEAVAPTEAPAPTQETKEDVTKFTTKKSKAAAKTVKLKYQFQIMLALGIPLEDIHKFANPQHWLQFFPPICQNDLTSFGCRIDWRRSFVTTDANPYYDSFVRWQFNVLRGLGKIKFGKRYTVYSPKDGQPCMDHDRSEGEGIGVQEYTAIKLKVLEWPEAAKKKIENSLPAAANVYFVPATLRPETMYGQTCCFVGPSLTYGIYQAGKNEYYFISERAARNMSFQNIFAKWGEFPKVADIRGSDVVGTLVHAPLSVHTKGVRILPMETVKSTKGTGVVTSVPSDSPDDYATVMDLAKKAEYYHIQKEWASLDIIPIIETPSYGNVTAKYLVEKMKINSPKDAKQLAEAKDLAYKEGYYKGTMLIGDFKGQPVIEAKAKVQQQLIDSGEAFAYAEPDGFVLSRSSDECVAAHLDQWYLNYGKAELGGDGEWQQQVLDHVSNDMRTFTTETKNAFQQTLDWLKQWPCARQYGLGSKLPWDHSFLVESLSDSAIYMSYYTIAHLLHSDIYGRHMGSAQVKPEQMTDEVWDYVFTRRENVKTEIPKAALESMRREFEYWYPLDFRTSAKDLANNHLIFFLYIHLVIFPKSAWPKGVRLNGHLILNGEKMSKSTGNFLTLSEAVKKFGADATRITMADAGDGMDDANFEETVANASILRLYELRKWCEEMVKEKQLVQSAEEYRKARDSVRMKNTDVIQRTGPKGFWDKLFENELNTLVHETNTQYDTLMFKAALKSGFYEFTSARDFYREACRAAGIGMHADLSALYIELQALMLTPIAPHWAEYVWREILGKEGSVQNADFPVRPAPDASLTAAREYVRSTSSNITSAEGAQVKKLAKGKTAAFDPKQPKKLTVFTAKAYPGWQDRAIELVREAFDGLSVEVKKVLQKVEKAESKKAMPFVNALKKRLEGGESPQAVFERKLAFDEVDVLREMVPGLRQTIQKCAVVEIVAIQEGAKKGAVLAASGDAAESKHVGKEGDERDDLPPSAEAAVPGGPTFHFENI